MLCSAHLEKLIVIPEGTAHSVLDQMKREPAHARRMGHQSASLEEEPASSRLGVMFYQMIFTKLSCVCLSQGAASRLETGERGQRQPPRMHKFLQLLANPVPRPGAPSCDRG